MASTPVSLPGESHGRRSLAGCSPWGGKELDKTEKLRMHRERQESEDGSKANIKTKNKTQLQCL